MNPACCAAVSAPTTQRLHACYVQVAASALMAGDGWSFECKGRCVYVAGRMYCARCAAHRHKQEWLCGCKCAAYGPFSAQGRLFSWAAQQAACHASTMLCSFLHHHADCVTCMCHMHGDLISAVVRQRPPVSQPRLAAASCCSSSCSICPLNTAHNAVRPAPLASVFCRCTCAWTPACS